VWNVGHMLENLEGGVANCCGELGNGENKMHFSFSLPQLLVYIQI